MIVKRYDEVNANPINQEGVTDTSIRWLIGPESKAPNFYLRFFEIEVNGHTPYHSHPWEHEIFILEGIGQIKTEKELTPVRKWDFALIMPDEKHQIQNTGQTTFKLLCIIPKHGK